jgi:hypothetical protein
MKLKYPLPSNVRPHEEHYKIRGYDSMYLMVSIADSQTLNRAYRSKVAARKRR